MYTRIVASGEDTNYSPLATRHSPLATLRIADYVDRDDVDRCGSTCIVDHVCNRAGGQRYGQQVVELHSCPVRCLESVVRVDRGIYVKVAVTTHPVALERRHIVTHLERSVPVHCAVHPACLVGRVIRHFILEEDVCSVVAVPDHFVVLIMLYEQAIGRYVRAIDHHARIRCVQRPAHAGSVIGPPGPNVVEYGVIVVHHQAGGCLADTRPTDAEEHVMEGCRVGNASISWHARAYPQEYRRVDGTGIEYQPGDLDPVDAGHLHWHDAVVGDYGRQAHAVDDGLGAKHIDRLIHVVDTRRKYQIEVVLQRLVDGRRAVSRMGHEESIQRD